VVEEETRKRKTGSCVRAKGGAYFRQEKIPKKTGGGNLGGPATKQQPEGEFRTLKRSTGWVFVGQNEEKSDEGRHGREGRTRGIKTRREEFTLPHQTEK